MIVFPKAKINLGLNVVERRPDGYHNLETVFFPLSLHDALEVTVMDDRFPSAVNCDLKVTSHLSSLNSQPSSLNSHLSSLTSHPSNQFDTGDEQRNLVVRAYNMLKEEFPPMPRVHAHLFKAIPTQAGMGGGSSDCASMLMLLNSMFHLGLSESELIDRAARLGADCAFFILSRPAYAEGIGERLQAVDLSIAEYQMVVVCPSIPVSTKEAFSLIHPKKPAKNCLDVVRQPVDTWRDELRNDFEQSVFSLHPEISDIKERLYQLGAVYAAMSGSGSAVFGLFRNAIDPSGAFPGMFTWSGPAALN